MDPRLLRHYDQELSFLREMGGEFAEQFPKVAARLGMQGLEVADPYVERLLEGFAFLAARVQLKIDAEFPNFTQRMLEILYPHFLAPTPSILVARFLPDVNDPSLAQGSAIERGSALQGQVTDATACDFRTTQRVTLLPLSVERAAYFTFAPDLPLNGLRLEQRVAGGLRIKLRLGGGLRFDQLRIGHLPIYFSGPESRAHQLYEYALGACIGMLVVPSQRPVPWHQWLPGSDVRAMGFDDDTAALPATLREFQGYRLLHEYSACPTKFLFADLFGLDRAFARCGGDELEIVLLFSRGDASLEALVDDGDVALFCSPAINLFEKRADRIRVEPGTHAHHLIVDRTRPMDFEVHDVQSVTGFGSDVEARRTFVPLYAAYHQEAVDHQAYFTLHREPRLLSESQKQKGARSSYVGTEVFVSLVDPDDAPVSLDLAQLAVTALVTNRDLPLHLPLGGRSDLTIDGSAPVTAIRVIRAPSRPYSALREGNVAWRFINHLSLNYLTLADDRGNGAAALRDLLALYGPAGDSALTKQVDGLRRIQMTPLVRRLPLPGPLTFGRGLEIALTVEERAFQGVSPFLFGAVLERFFARYVSINSFTETVLRSEDRGEIARWIPRVGERAIV